MKSKYNWSIFELDSLLPNELEIFYFMRLAEFKKEHSK